MTDDCIASITGRQYHPKRTKEAGEDVTGDEKSL